MSASAGAGGDFSGPMGGYGPEAGTILSGGTTNHGLVTRVGDTVRRPRRPTSASTRALLEHLAQVGFEGAPRYLGVDELGREVLSYVDGQAATAPLAEWSLTEEAVVSVAVLLRRYHDAIASFDAERWPWARQVPEQWRAGLVSHNDPNLDNVVFRDGQAFALIDFDLAATGSAVWDVACAARLWAPLRADVDVDAGRRGRSLTRLRLFVDAYGLAARERARLVDAIVDAHHWCYEVVYDAVRARHPVFAPYWENGAAEIADRTQHWLRTHGASIRDAVSDAVDDRDS